MLSDFGVIIWAAVRIKVNRSLSPIIVTFNLCVNAITLMCSYADYHRRLFPFLKWTTNVVNNPSHHGSNKSSMTKPRSLFGKGEGRVKKLQKQKTVSSINEVVLNRCEDAQKASIDEIFIYPNIFIKLPPSLAENIKKKSESGAKSDITRTLKNDKLTKFKNKEPKKIKSPERRNLDEPCRPISFITNKRENIRVWKFLELVRRRPNLEEYETSV